MRLEKICPPISNESLILTGSFLRAPNDFVELLLKTSLEECNQLSINESNQHIIGGNCLMSFFYFVYIF